MLLNNIKKISLRMRCWVRRTSEEMIHELFIKEDLPAMSSDVETGCECEE